MNDYDTDILLWSERQAELLRRHAGGELTGPAGGNRRHVGTAIARDRLRDAWRSFWPSRRAEASIPSMRPTLKVLATQLAFVFVINSPALANRCCTMQPDCEGMWTATADMFPVVCFRVNYGDGQKTNFCLRRGQTRQVKIRSGDTISFWANNAPIPDDQFSTPVCTD